MDVATSAPPIPEAEGRDAAGVERGDLVRRCDPIVIVIAPETERRPLRVGVRNAAAERTRVSSATRLDQTEVLRARELVGYMKHVHGHDLVQKAIEALLSEFASRGRERYGAAVALIEILTLDLLLRARSRDAALLRERCAEIIQGKGVADVYGGYRAQPLPEIRRKTVTLHFRDESLSVAIRARFGRQKRQIHQTAEDLVREKQLRVRLAVERIDRRFRRRRSFRLQPARFSDALARQLGIGPQGDALLQRQ
ncbi:MAG TPA: hypothetical protein VHL59_09730 [Thermoanaerobaculia bacterium]|nr:hypothetical protein [Thermoanaerobaculia bacterium]